jgi:hypothetical protein
VARVVCRGARRGARRLRASARRAPLLAHGPRAHTHRRRVPLQHPWHRRRLPHGAPCAAVCGAYVCRTAPRVRQCAAPMSAARRAADLGTMVWSSRPLQTMVVLEQQAALCSLRGQWRSKRKRSPRRNKPLYIYINLLCCHSLTLQPRRLSMLSQRYAVTSQCSQRRLLGSLYSAFRSPSAVTSQCSQRRPRTW